MLHEKQPMPFELHELFDGSLKLYQPKQGYRFSVDSILLAEFAAAKAYGHVADLGAGSGVLSLLLSRSAQVQQVTALEIQGDLVELILKNVSLNRCEGKVSVTQCDIRQIRKHFPAGFFDTVITNPPFYAAGTGKVNPDAQKAAARHEVHGTLQDFLRAAAYLLKTGGSFFAVYNAERTADLIAGMRQERIEPKVMQCVHPHKGEPATMVLVEGIKGAGVALSIRPPLFVAQR